MLFLKKALFAALTTTVAIAPVCAQAKQAKPLVVSAPREIVNPYKTALDCLKSQLTPEQRGTSIGVLYFADRAGKEAYAPDGASGKFLSQGAEDMLINYLRDTGMRVAEVGPTYRSMLDWSLQKPMNPNASRSMLSADIIVQGSFTTFDFGSSNVNELYVFGIGGGTRAYSVKYTMDMRASSMLGGAIPGGEVIATLSLEKDVVGREKRAGVAGFFGNSGSSTYVELNINHQKRELLQYSQRYMASRAAFGIVAKIWNITACDAHLNYSDAIMSGQVPETLPSAKISSQTPEALPSADVSGQTPETLPTAEAPLTTTN